MFSKEVDQASMTTMLASILPEKTQIVKEVLEPEDEGEVFTHKLITLKAKLEKKKAENLLNKIVCNLDDYDIKEVNEALQSHMSDDCIFYIRLSKRELTDGNYVIDSKDPVHLKFKIAAYPAKKENAIQMIEDMIQDAKVH